MLFPWETRQAVEHRPWQLCFGSRTDFEKTSPRLRSIQPAPILGHHFNTTAVLGERVLLVKKKLFLDKQSERSFILLGLRMHLEGGAEERFLIWASEHSQMFLFLNFCVAFWWIFMPDRESCYCPHFTREVKITYFKMLSSEGELGTFWSVCPRTQLYLHVFFFFVAFRALF